MKISKFLSEGTLLGTLFYEDSLKKNKTFPIIKTHIPQSSSCQEASAELFKILYRLKSNVEIVDGFYKGEGHTWLRVDGFVVDPVAYIFDDFPNMDVGEYNEIQSFGELSDWIESNGYVNEAMRTWKLSSYKSSRKRYKLHDKHPHILIIDPRYPPNKTPDSYLAFNLNYIKERDKKDMLKSIQKYDDKFIDKIKDVDDIIAGFLGEATKKKASESTKKYLRRMMGFYDLKGDEAKKRYHRLVNKWPFLLKIIRRYKYEGINKD